MIKTNQTKYNYKSTLVKNQKYFIWLSLFLNNRSRLILLSCSKLKIKDRKWKRNYSHRFARYLRGRLNNISVNSEYIIIFFSFVRTFCYSQVNLFMKHIFNR